MSVAGVNYVPGLPRVALRHEFKDDLNPWSPEKKFEVVWVGGSTVVYSYHKENPIPKLPTFWWACCGERQAWQIELDRQMAKALVSA
jgi:hypothetical protein